ncbi:ABC transporter ATP-binding protein [Streptomyces sp. AK02-01A]|uniref:ABC transporter ATP-binding protein n=1 Tax=Streptomyces sp. AK02-01A TaxID=3028648 RepID=UPI0029A9BB2B|nr:ABC transporter ATP-binding protein [Streptomyces sp. AK02-01A]MDX3851712.1 ABC transporter ATP-binding protein [Streptomyces sp. AK02-01A]
MSHSPRPVIDFRAVGLQYPGPPPVRALDSCDLTVHSGDYLTVVGPSGSGKSTFLNLAGLLDTPTSGRYLLNGIDTRTLSDSGRAGLRARHIGFVFQAFHLLGHRSALENVELSMLYQRIPARRRRAQAAEALDRVGMSHRSHATPARLSGGERQRVAIARALAARPSLLLCDEPTGNLDTRNRQALLDLLDRLHRDGMTLVVITHDPYVSDRGQRTVTIQDGRLTEASGSRTSV